MRKLPLKYFFILIFPIILVLPIPLVFSSIALGLALLNLLLVHFDFFKRGNFLKRFKENTLLIFGCSIVTLDILTHFFRHLEFEWIFRDVRISFLLVPLIFFISRDKVVPLKKHLLISLVIGVLGYILYAYGYMVYFYSSINYRSFEISHYLVYDLRQNLPGAYHHTYIGMYMVFAIAILLWQFGKKYYWQRIALAIFITLNQILIGGKITFFLSVLIFAAYLLEEIKKTRFFSRLICAFAILILLSGGLLYKSGFLNSASFSASNRIESWKCSAQAFFNKPLFGYGHEETVVFLKNCISSNAVSTHNQFLEEFMNYGLFGLWLPMFFIFLFFKSKSTKLFRFFLLITCSVSFFENILSLQRGVLFFTFYIALFWQVNFKMKSEKSIYLLI